MYPETAQPTRKLLTVGLWLFAVAIAYPYLPGSDSEAFKGMSVFVGLVVSLGSSGIVNQVMSGFTLTYSRALRVGDFVAVGDVEGTVTQVGTLSTKITTGKGEDVTIPNARGRVADRDQLLAIRRHRRRVRADRDHHRLRRAVAAGRGAAAARGRPHAGRPSRTGAGRPAVGARGCLRQIHACCSASSTLPQRRTTLAAVHANILDAFNEYGVQITSPNYEADPRPKIVPRDQWFARPQRPPAVQPLPRTPAQQSHGKKPRASRERF